MYNSSGSFNGIVPSGEQMWFGCEQGFYPSEPMISTCQEDGLWHPDPCEAVCESKRFCISLKCIFFITYKISEECLVPVNLTNMELSLMNGDSSTSLRIFFHCKDGFFPKDEQTAVCSGNGTWFPDLTQFECHRRMAPTLISNFML